MFDITNIWGWCTSLSSTGGESSPVSFDPSNVRRSSWVQLLNFIGGICDNVYHIEYFTSVKLLDEAKRMTALEDFGEMDLQCLEHLLESVRVDARLNFIGRIAARQEILRVLQNRLYIENHLKNFPQIKNVPIRKPVFIVGLSRTGTTLLFNILAKDKRFRTIPLWEGHNPAPPPGDDNRREDEIRKVSFLKSLQPNFTAIHDVKADAPEECVTLLQHTLQRGEFHSMLRLPSFQEWLRHREDNEPEFTKRMYDYYFTLLQILQFERPGENFLLKAPLHLAYLETLLQRFPDACIIWSHREPTSILPSYCSMICHLRASLSNEVDPQDIGKELLEATRWEINRAIKVRREQRYANNFFDVHFSDLMRNPMEIVEGIYQKFHFTLDDTTRERMKEHLLESPPTPVSRHKYSLGQFGLSRDQIENSFPDYPNCFKTK